MLNSLLDALSATPLSMTASAAHGALWVAIRLVALAAGLLPSAPITAAADVAGAIAVVYPDIAEPYRSVFAQIIDGVQAQVGGRVARFPVGASVDAQELAASLRRQGVRVVIALGRNGLKATSALQGDIAVVAGGVLSLPESQARGMTVHSLAPDPALLFARLKQLLPATRRVFVIHDPRYSSWLIRHAAEAARAHDLDLAAIESNDLKAAIRHYEEVLASANPRHDAVWLPQDATTVEESAVLPLVLQQAWTRGLAVFSSSVSHVRRGALFSLYPDNLALGRTLANSAIARLSPGIPAPRGTRALTDVLLAVNVRTANHLGIDVSSRRQSFDMVFPEP